MYSITPILILVVGVCKSETPTSEPTTSFEDIGAISHINWNNLISNGGDEILDISYNITISSTNLELFINVIIKYNSNDDDDYNDLVRKYERPTIRESVFLIVTQMNESFDNKRVLGQ